jgi:DNA-binding IclR family transcriptional regulator
VKTGLPETTIRRVEEDLVVLGLADHRKASNKWRVSQSDVAREYWRDTGETP